MGLSGANCDEWFKPNPGTEVLVALALAHSVAARRGDSNASWLAKYSATEVEPRTEIPAARLERLAERIARAEAPLALPPGIELLGTNAASFNTAVQILNHFSGAIGKTVVFGPDHNLAKLARFRDVKELAGKMRGGEGGVLLIHGTNPVYTVPQVGFADAMAQSGLFKVSFSSASDETTALADLILPDHTAYESWGDPEPVHGIRRVQQPTVRPLMNTRAIGDVLVEAATKLGKGEELGAAGFRERVSARWGAGFEKALADGGSFEAAPSRDVVLNERILPKLEFEPAQLGGDGDLTLLAYPSLHFYDGRSARIAMLQEVPDPVLKTTWGSFAEMNPDTAAERSLVRGDVIRVTTEAGSIELPVFPHEGVRRGIVAVAIGQGHQPVNPDAPPLSDRHARRKRIGVNVLEILPGRLD
jgi:molybdopterin-containing oxidoreductase family iron-sulfur binding subunit